MVAPYIEHISEGPCEEMSNLPPEEP